MRYNGKFINFLFGQTSDIRLLLSYWSTSSFGRGVVLVKSIFSIFRMSTLLAFIFYLVEITAISI